MIATAKDINKDLKSKCISTSVLLYMSKDHIIHSRGQRYVVPLQNKKKQKKKVM